MSLPPKSRAHSPRVPGVLKSTTFLQADDPSSFGFWVDKLDANNFELAFYTLDDEDGRIEHVINLPYEGLVLLSQEIASRLYQHNKIMKQLQRDL